MFATRSPRRPNPIGLTVVELLRREGVELHVRGVDMLDGTPILDIKPKANIYFTHIARCCILAIAVTGLWFWKAGDRNFQFFPVDFARRQILVVRNSVGALHFVGLTFALLQQEEPIQRSSKILEMEPFADSLTKPIAVFKFPRRQEHSVQIDELMQSLRRNLPKQTLIRRASGYINSAERLDVWAFSVLGSIHGLEQMICREFSKRRIPLSLSGCLKIGRNRINKGGIRAPVEFGRDAPVILKINDDRSVTSSVFGPDNIGHSTIWPTYGHIRAFAYCQRILGAFIPRFSEEQKENVYQEQSSGTYADSDFDSFFPSWGIILAPTGIIALYWGWWPFGRTAEFTCLPGLAGVSCGCTGSAAFLPDWVSGFRNDNKATAVPRRARGHQEV